MGKLNNRQTIPAGGFEPSASGGLHNSSMGETYPWTVIGRVVVFDSPREVGFDCWSAFNCLTGETGPKRGGYDIAQMDMALMSWGYPAIGKQATTPLSETKHGGLAKHGR